MQNRKIHNQFTTGLACGLMMITTTAIAAGPVSQYSLRATAEQSNPWALTQTPNSAAGYQRIPKSWRPHNQQQNQHSQIKKYRPGFRFVTPEILQSLKHQQIQTQLMTGNNQRPLMPRQSIQNHAYPPGFQQTPKTTRPQYQVNRIEKYKRSSRFVTPETLESLKHQQIQTLLMTKNNQRPLLQRQSIQNHAYPSGFQQTAKSWRPQYQSSQVENYRRGSRFVTSEILESLKQQQIQTQLMPENKQRPLLTRQSIQNYGYPSSGMGYTNPLYDTPAVSPWASGSDVLYGGTSSPFVPKEATGGLSPIHIPPFANNNGVYEPVGTNIQKESNTFKPYNFGYYSYLQ
ncbi:MAG: hypothetical protein DRQ44_16140 [Gammaproteobacteria bacterium]|nr:MAG: hypothetical protein DRQ44_16140 [Gammaproteobacteria bacterium]